MTKKDGGEYIYGGRSIFKHGERVKMTFLLELVPGIMFLLKIIVLARGVVGSLMATLSSGLQLLFALRVWVQEFLRRPSSGKDFSFFLLEGRNCII